MSAKKTQVKWDFRLWQQREDRCGRWEKEVRMNLAKLKEWSRKEGEDKRVQKNLFQNYTLTNNIAAFL